MKIRQWRFLEIVRFVASYLPVRMASFTYFNKIISQLNRNRELDLSSYCDECKFTNAAAIPDFNSGINRSRRGPSPSNICVTSGDSLSNGYGIN